VYNLILLILLLNSNSKKIVVIMSINRLTVGVQPFYGKGRPPLLWAGTWKKTVIGVPNRLNYFVIFVTCK
jgi:hypothetical protein